jgi:hypothetical protein
LSVEYSLYSSDIIIANSNSVFVAMSGEKLSCCSYVYCTGKSFRPDQSCFVCGAGVHAICFTELCVGQNYTPGNFYCSVQCIRYDADNNIDNNTVKSRREI